MNHPLAIGHSVATLDDSGTIIRLAISRDHQASSCSIPLRAFTRLSGFVAADRPVLTGASQSGYTIQTKLKDPQGRKCLLKEILTPTANSIRWDVEIHSLEEHPFTTGIESILQFSQAEALQFWTTWGDNRLGDEIRRVNERMLANHEIDSSAYFARYLKDRTREETFSWSDPLQPGPFADRQLWYGAPHVRDYWPEVDEYAPYVCDVFSIPVASVMDEREDWGISLALSPEDTTFDMKLSVTRQGEIAFSRMYHRFAKGAPLKFSMDLIIHSADWRSAMKWYTGRYADYFHPLHPEADQLSGTGAYANHVADIDAEKLKRMTFRLNWMATFDFPYMGMFLPPVKDDQEWTSCVNRTTSLSAMNDYINSMEDNGFHVLNYFNVTEFGANIEYPYQKQSAEPIMDEQWKNANEFLYNQLGDAIFYKEKDAGDARPIWTWMKSVVMDPGEPVYQQFLVEQAKRHIEKLPHSAGICMDRMDWTRLYNDRRDDGLCWLDDRPARSLFTSWQEVIHLLGPLFHQAGKAVFCNNHTKRIDQLKHIDGFFDEHSYSGPSLNTTAFLGMFKPIIGWVDSDKDLGNDADAFFQKFLYMGVFPMAPFPGNDHALQPSDQVDQLYLDYAPLFRSIKGRKWVLEPHLIEIGDRDVRANVFQVNEGYAIPVVFGEETTEITISLKLLETWMSEGAVSSKAFHPGGSRSIPLQPEMREGRLSLKVPLVRGCALVLVNH